MQLLAVLVGHDGTGCGTCISGDLWWIVWSVIKQTRGERVSSGVLGRKGVLKTYNNTAVEDTPYDCGTGAGGLGQRDALGVEGRIAVVVGEVEARHVGQARRRERDWIWQ